MIEIGKIYKIYVKGDSHNGHHFLVSGYSGTGFYWNGFLIEQRAVIGVCSCEPPPISRRMLGENLLN